ncbi:MAG: M23 family metallopeptidase [Gemmatimonadota bacterium]
MRRVAVVLVALAVSGCARQLYSTSAPASKPSSTPVTLAGATNVARPIVTPVSSVEAVDYLLASGLLLPVAGVATAQLRDTFDEGRDGGRVHRALDIMSPRGTPILSADDGRVLRIGFNELGGNSIYASDSLGRVVYYYAHLDAYRPGLVQGALIARGDTLGFVGTTGNAPKDTPHLHFQVMRMPPDGKYWDGDPINPFPILLLTHEHVRP